MDSEDQSAAEGPAQLLTLHDAGSVPYAARGLHPPSPANGHNIRVRALQEGLVH